MAEARVGRVFPAAAEKSWRSWQGCEVLGRHQQPAEGLEGDEGACRLSILATSHELMPLLYPLTYFLVLSPALKNCLSPLLCVPASLVALGNNTPAC